MDRRTIILFAAAILLAPLALAIPADGDGTAMTLDECRREIMELRVDINLLNLYNGLNLTIDQVSAILEEARAVAPAAGTKTGVQDRESRRAAEEEHALLEDLNERLRESRDVPGTMRARLDTIKQKQWRAAKGMKQDAKQMAEIGRRAAAVEAVLTDSQIEVLRTFKPCLIPPKDLRDPVRVGQAAGHGQSASFLERIRKLPDFVYTRNRDKIRDGVVSAAEKHNGRMSGEARAAYGAKVLDAMDRARAMNETDFLFSKQDLALQIEPEDRVQSIQDQLSDMGIAHFEIQGKVAQYFLTPRAIPILEKRLELMKEFKRKEKVDLDNVEGAENCKDGKCAIDE